MSEMTFTDKGVTWPFVEDENGVFWGEGHPPRGVVAQWITDYLRTVDPHHIAEWGPVEPELVEYIHVHWLTAGGWKVADGPYYATPAWRVAL